MTIREALLSMCYREEKPGIWAKPVGCMLFTFNEKQLTWENWYLSLTGKIGLWDSVQFEGDSDFLGWLKDTEAWTRVNVCPESGSHFELKAFDL